MAPRVITGLSSHDIVSAHSVVELSRLLVLGSGTCCLTVSDFRHTAMTFLDDIWKHFFFGLLVCTAHERCYDNALYNFLFYLLTLLTASLVLRRTEQRQSGWDRHAHSDAEYVRGWVGVGTARAADLRLSVTTAGPPMRECLRSCSLKSRRSIVHPDDHCGR